MLEKFSTRSYKLHRGVSRYILCVLVELILYVFHMSFCQKVSSRYYWYNENMRCVCVTHAMCVCDGVHYPTVSYPYRLLVDNIVQVPLTNNIIVAIASATLSFDCSLLQGHRYLNPCLHRQAHIFLVKYSLDIYTSTGRQLI